MSYNMEEMRNLIRHVDLANRTAALKGQKIISYGRDFGEIQTVADKGISHYLLNGGGEFPGLRNRYRGSFSEEEDSPYRLSERVLMEVDPRDGTGDSNNTYRSKRQVGPTTLISMLMRLDTKSPFESSGGMIYNALWRYAIISDGSDIKLYEMDGDAPKEVPIIIDVDRQWKAGDPVKINGRLSYTQHVYDGPYIKFLRKNGLNAEQLYEGVGGAGEQALRVFRNFIHPARDVPGFSDLQPLTIIDNAQPDWKAWDTNPNVPFAKVLRLPTPTDFSGGELKANAANQSLSPDDNSLSHMHHTRGYVLSTDGKLQKGITDLAKLFIERNPDCDIFAKDYGYSKRVIQMVERAD